MKGWSELGVVGTIYEEDPGGGSKSPSFSASPAGSSPLPSDFHRTLSSLHQRVEEWSQATGSKTDVAVHVHDQCFHLHKEPLVSRSGYLRRHLTEPDNITIALPSTITAEAFAVAADFCYGAEISITPFNVAGLRTAAEWLEMAEDESDGDENLLEKTEWYFCRAIATGADCTALVLRTCLGLLHDATEPAVAFLVARCAEALAASGGFEKGRKTWLDDLSSCTAEEFQLIANALRSRLEEGHDLLYEITDHYLESCKEEKLTEEEKNRICCAMECRKLSRHLLIHLVRNPRMPLRFVVQAMLVEQFNTRVCIFGRTCKTKRAGVAASAAASTTGGGTVTLGSILQRDAALRQAAHLKVTMEATSFRIQSLERDLEDLKMKLKGSKERDEADCEEDRETARGRSASFRFHREAEAEANVSESEGSVLRSERSSVGVLKDGRGLGRKLIHGFKNAFRTTVRSGSESRSMSCSGDGDVVAVPEESRRTHHRRHGSFS